MIEELPQTDPKLKDALAEIQSICSKYGIGAVISLASSTHAEFKVIFPQWSGLQIKDGQFRLKLHHTEPEKAGATAHLAYSLRDMCGLMFQNFEAITEVFAKHLKVEHKPFSKLWDLDGWQKPGLPPMPYETVDLKKHNSRKRNRKGFGQPK
jgi:hypothetical protein